MLSLTSSVPLCVSVCVFSFQAFDLFTRSCLSFQISAVDFLNYKRRFESLRVQDACLEFRSTFVCECVM